MALLARTFDPQDSGEDERANGPVARLLTSTSEAVASVPDLEAEIDAAYEAIADLSHLPATPERDARVELAFACLRELQHREADQFRQQFEENLMMPLDAGARILERSRNLRKQLEDPAASDSSAEEPASA